MSNDESTYSLFDGIYKNSRNDYLKEIKLIDGWIFHGKWHQDLPIAPCDIGLVEDRQSWKEAYKPIQTNLPWFIPVEELAYCGKALSLLSLSKKSEKFLNMLKSGDRPKVKLCLQLNELKELKTECCNYYEKAKNSLHTEETEKLNLILSAEISAKKRAVAFEELKNEEKGNEMERKRKELHMREEDLIRSAKVKEERKKIEELDDKRVASEMEEILFKEKLQEIEEGKEIYKRIKEVQDLEEKHELKTNWKLRRQQNTKKRQDFFNNDQHSNKHNMVSGEPKSLENKGIDIVDLNLIIEKNSLEKKDLLSGTDECNNANECDNSKYSELVKNRLKVLGSGLGLGDHQAGSLCEKGIAAETEKLALKAIETSEIFERNDTNNEILEISDTNKYSELVKNRLKSLNSDFSRGDAMTFTVGQFEAERNKNKILGSHFILGTDFRNREVENINVNCSNELPEKNEESAAAFYEMNDICDNEIVGKCEAESKEITCDPIDNTNRQTTNGIKICSDLEVTDLSDHDKIDDEPEARKYSGVNGVSCFHNCYRQIEAINNLSKATDQHQSEQWSADIPFRDLFKMESQVLLPQQPLDHYCLCERVPGSLKLVLETQVKLVNEALLGMFLDELKLLDEAGKLKKYFFLDGEFGKKLTSSLCVAIEREKPSVLLTFGKLSDLLTIASQGDEKVSFIVKNTPIAFEYTNPQALSCLGMSYEFNWPLNLIFTDIALSKYNDVFEYILSLERVTWHLDQVWLALKFKSSQMKGHEYRQIQLYRHVMSQFVCTLRWYITTTVFETCWQKFNRDVLEVTNLEELYKKHAAYIKEVIFKCFLDERSVGLMKRVQSLLKYILIFCQVIRFGEWSISEIGDYHHCDFTKIQKTFSSFFKISRSVVEHIEKLVKINYQDGLSDLYNLLTINRFYIA